MPEVREKREPRLPTGPPVEKPKPDQELIPDDDELITKEDSKGKGEDKFEEIKTARIPAPPSKTLNSENKQLFYTWLAELKPEHWAQLTWYMYRLWPRITRPDGQNWIDKGLAPVDDEWILHHHGGGDYMFMCNQAGKPKNAKTICTAYVKNLSHPDYPPMVKLDELDVHHPGNKTFVDRMVAEGKLSVDLKPMTQTMQQGALSDTIILKLIDRLDKNQVSTLKDPKDQAITEAFQIISRGNETATKLMLDQMKENSPETLIKLVTLITGLLHKPDNGGSSDTTTMMKMLVDSQNKTAELLAKKDETIMAIMTKMLDKANAAPVVAVAVDEFDKFLDRMTKFNELTGAGEGGGGKKSTLETVLQYSMPVLNNVAGVIQNLLALKASGAPKIGEVPNAPNVAVTTTPITETDGTGKPIVRTNNNTNTNGGDVKEAMLNNSSEADRQIVEGLRQMGPRIIDALSRGITGDAFAESIEGFLGPMVYNRVASLGKPRMLEILKTDQQLWSQLGPVEPVLVKFIDDFIAYGADGGDGDDLILDDDSKEPSTLLRSGIGEVK